MRLLSKFTLIFASVFAVGLVVVGYVAHNFLQQDAKSEVMQQARLMLETARAARNYTETQVAPLLESTKEHSRTFLPQTIPFFAATESFNYLRKKYPDYTYKEATLNPMNLRDRALDWEADVINTFRNEPKMQELVGERETPTGKSIFLARPIATDQSCMACHDTPAKAPTALIRRYGAQHGFGWKPGEIVGAQIVAVPETVPVASADSGFRQLMINVGAIFLLSLVLLDLVVVLAVSRPVSRLSAMADEISLGNLDAPELPVKGKDEVSVLAGSFNRMRRSLVQALRLLEQ
ncbi:MAG TPA: DUF3365 domain-containing protein [Bryobacteraceae bacterium]|jgi:protein-histidine pros-kinase